MAAANADLTKDIAVGLEKLYGIGSANSAARTTAKTGVAPTAAAPARTAVADADTLAVTINHLAALITDLRALGVLA